MCTWITAPEINFKVLLMVNCSLLIFTYKCISLLVLVVGARCQINETTSVLVPIYTNMLFLLNHLNFYEQFRFLTPISVVYLGLFELCLWFGQHQFLSFGLRLEFLLHGLHHAAVVIGHIFVADIFGHIRFD